MKVKDFVDNTVTLLNNYGCDVRYYTYDFKLADAEILDTYHSRFRMYISTVSNSIYRNTDVLVMDFYIDNTLIHIHIEACNLGVIDPLTALMEMNMPRLMIRSMAYLSDIEKVHCTLRELIDDFVFSNNDKALSNALNTEFEMLCKENLYCLYALRRDDIQFGPFGMVIPQELLFTFGLPSKFIKNLIKKYPESTKCIPILLRYLEDHFVSDDKEEIIL